MHIIGFMPNDDLLSGRYYDDRKISSSFRYVFGVRVSVQLSTGSTTHYSNGPMHIAYGLKP